MYNMPHSFHLYSVVDTCYVLLNFICRIELHCSCRTLKVHMNYLIAKNVTRHSSTRPITAGTIMSHIMYHGTCLIACDDSTACTYIRESVNSLYGMRMEMRTCRKLLKSFQTQNYKLIRLFMCLTVLLKC